MSSFPDFFASIPSITMFDPLAQALGVNSDGMLEYRYEDAVKLAGHSCPTVAGAWLMTQSALKALYPDQTPVRGMVDVSLKAELEEGVAGVIASVATLITGASGAGGFKGLQGKFSRQNLLFFAQEMPEQMRFKRLDNGLTVEVSYDPALVPASAEMMKLMQKLTAGAATVPERENFANLWQNRVKEIFMQAEKLCIVYESGDEK